MFWLLNKIAARSRTYYNVLYHRNISHRVFVYGTLKRNEPNHYWLTDATNGKSQFISEGQTKEKYPLIIATKYNIPFLLLSPGKGYNVKGEIYNIDDLMLTKLDILEGYPDYYTREKTQILASDGAVTECLVYFLKNFKPELLNKNFLENYSSAGSHGLPYLEVNNESSVDDLDDVLQKKSLFLA